MGKLRESINNVLKNIEKYFSEKETVYVESKDGKYAIVDDSYLQELQSSLNDLKSLLVSQEYKDDKMCQQIISEIEGINVNDLSTEQIEQLARVTRKTIQKLPQIDISTFSENSRGGFYATVKAKNDKAEKNLGAVVASKKDEHRSELSGEYIKEDDVLECFDGFVKGVKEIKVSKGINDKKSAEENTRRIIRENKSELSEIIKKSAETEKTLQSTKKLKKKTIHKGAYKAAIVGLSLALVISMANKRGTEVVISRTEAENFSISETIENEKDALTSIIGDNYINEIGANQEGQTIGEKNVQEPEVEARNNRIENMNSVQEIEQESQEIEEQYSKIENPTNKQWIDYQLQNFEVYGKYLELHQDVAEKTDSYINEWNEFNTKHIEKGSLSARAESEHRAEIEYNLSESDKVNKDIIGVKESQEKNSDRIEFFSRFANLENIESIKNIQQVAESLYKFSKSDIGQKMGNDKLFETIERTSPDLFANFSNQDIKVENYEEFMESYLKIELAYNTYIEQYCNGDNSKIDENLYVQYMRSTIRQRRNR